VEYEVGRQAATSAAVAGRHDYAHLSTTYQYIVNLANRQAIDVLEVTALPEVVNG